jgi:isopenicillin-N N-acyltransferase-like protein
MDTYITLTLQGDYYTMGWQHGRQVRKLRSQILQAIEARLTQIEQDGPDTRFEALLRETCDLLAEIDGPLLAMIRGQADALEFDFDTLLRYDLASHLRDALLTRKPPAIEGCTTWAATGSATASGQPILVKNRDYLPEHLPIQIVIHATPESGYRYVCNGSAGSPGVFCAGINQAGLAVADTHVISTDLGPGLPDYALMMHLLETHDNVSSALDYLRSVPRLGRNNLILADTGGHLAVFEIGHRQYGLFETHDGTLVNANHFASAELRDCFVDVGPPEARGKSFRRYEKVACALNAAFGQIDVPFAQRLMATHDGPLASICCHPEADSRASTLSASIFLPVQRKMLFCHGLPCQGHYDGFAI